MAAAVERATNNAVEFNHYLEAKKYLDPAELQVRINEDLKFFTQEYILQQNITRYSYRLRWNEQGLPYQIYSSGFEQEGDVINSFKRGFGERAEAELQGFQKVEEKIFAGGAEGNFFLWISPPGKAEEGFGTHNFTFIGHVLEDRVDMVAYKNWLSLQDNIQLVNKYLPDNQQLGEDTKDVDFLKTPIFLPGGERFKDHLDVIKYLKLDKAGILSDTDNRWLLGRLEPFRRAVISALEAEDIAGAERAKNAHDNYALALLYGYNTDSDSFDYWASQPAPLLRGSCGFSGGEESSFGAGLTYLGVEKKHFSCPRCKGNIESGKGITVCPHCGARKEDYKACD